MAAEGVVALEYDASSLGTAGTTRYTRSTEVPFFLTLQLVVTT